MHSYFEILYEIECASQHYHRTLENISIWDITDKHRIEQSFEVGDLVYLRLQPHIQSSLKKKGAEKLKPRFYGPYKIIR